MEFVGLGEVWSELSRRGVVERRRSDGEIELGVSVSGATDVGATEDRARRACMIEVGPGAKFAAKGDGAIDVDSEKAAATLEAVLHKLHLAPVYLIPVARWRNIFDVVSFGLAKNLHWQEIESQACLELNTRDPLECGPGDLHTVRDVVRTLLVDGDAASQDNSSQTRSQQGLMIVATGQLIVATVIPKRPIRIEIASVLVASNVRDAANHFLGRPSATP